MIARHLIEVLQAKLFSGKAIILLGARQTGKTTLAKQLVHLSNENAVFLNGDEPNTISLFENMTTEKWKQVIAGNKIVVVDEAQRIMDIGIKLKLCTDNFPDTQLIVTGSSALELANTINEPLTGRKWEYNLFPISWGELRGSFNYTELLNQFESRLVFGMYPEVVSNPGNEEELLKNLAGSYLYKDLLSFGNIRKPEVLHSLLRALAWQIGSEVSYNELSRLVNVDKNTVINYISLLEKAFVIFRLDPLNRNLRKEISTSRKIYFWDNGIRNALISNFNSLEMRNDIGALWENFIVAERLKYNHYNRRYVNYYFWRTNDGKEIDLVEESGGKFDVFEFKWSAKKKFKISDLFTKTYPTGNTYLINKENFMDIL